MKTHPPDSDANIVIVYRAPSIIERDALVNELRQNGIEALGADRDLSRKISNETVDLGFAGYSAMMGGFPISVMEADQARAKEIIDDFIKELSRTKGASLSSSHLKKFYACAIYSITLPLVFHIVGFYNLYKGIKAGERFKVVPVIGSVMLYICSGFLGVMMVKSFIFG